MLVLLSTLESGVGSLGMVGRPKGLGGGSFLSRTAELKYNFPILRGEDILSKFHMFRTAIYVKENV